jgi:hypothetical protein
MLVSILLLIFIFVIGGNSYLRENMTTTRIYTEAKKLSDEIAFEINTAVKIGDGYTRRFYVEDAFAGIYNFNIEVEGYLVKIKWNDGFVSSQIVTNNITGNVTKGWNLVENNNGIINVS